MTEINSMNAPYGTSPEGHPLDNKGNPAPWGLKDDGSPAAKPGRKPGQKNGSGQKSQKHRRPAAAAPEKKAQKKKAAGQPVYAEAIEGLLQLPAAALAMLGQNNPMYLADGQAIAMHAPNIATALDQTAQVNPSVAAALDRIVQIGPYGAIIAAVAPLVAQILTNHQLLPTNADGMGMLGAVNPQFLTGVAPAAEAAEPAAPDMDDFVPEQFSATDLHHPVYS